MFRLFLFLSIAAFGASLVLPVYAEKPDLPGYFALLGGWMVGVNDIPTAVSWLGNVMYFLAFIMILKRKNPKPRVALVFAILAIGFGCAILGAGKLVIGLGESEDVGRLVLGKAFYAWMGSFVLMAIAAWLKIKKPVTTTVPPTNEHVPDDSQKLNIS